MRSRFDADCVAVPSSQGAVGAAACGAATIFLGLAVLAGWVWDITILKSVLPGLVAMKANTALGFILAGTALSLGSARPPTRSYSWVRPATSGLVLLLGLFTLSQDVLGWDPGIDQLLFREPPGAPFTLHPGRMAPLTALSFTASGAALLLMEARRGIIAQGAALVTGLVALLAIGGYLFGAPAFSGFGLVTPLAVHTGLGFAILAAGVLMGTADRGLLSRVGGQLPLVGMSAAVVVFLAAGLAVFLNTRRMIDAASWIEHTHEVLERLEKAQDNVQAIGAGVHGFVASGKEEFLTGAAQARQELSGNLAAVQRLTADNLSQQERLAALGPLIQRCLALAEESVRIRREQGMDAAVADRMTGEADHLAAEIRTRISEIAGAEERLLALRRQAAASSAMSSLLATVFTGGGGLTLLIAMLAATRRANKALREEIRARERLQDDLERHFQVTQDLVCIAGFDGYLRQVNPAWVQTLGWTEAELTTRPFVDFVHPDDREATLRETDKVVGGGVTLSFENRYRCRDGSYRWLLWNATSDVGRRTVYAAARDITESKRAEEALRRAHSELEYRAAQIEEANKELESFSYSVSHDLRAPLRHVLGYADMLREAAGTELSEKARRYLDTICEVSREMGVLIDDLLSFSRMGRAEMHETDIALDALVHESLRRLEPVARGRNIVWQIGSLPRVQGDPAMLRQVFVNLLSNAVKYSRSRDPAVIEIGCVGEEDGRAILFVRDNGVGFDMQYAGKLFGVFQRLHHRDEFEGTGIGLATVRRIIARHGGRTWAESELNQGATFYFTLKPASPTNPPGDETEEKATP